MSDQKSYSCTVEGCEFKITGETEEEIYKQALDHAFSVHHEADTPEFRERVLRLIRDEIPAE
jgi:predicted small metal-binding protein